MSRGITVMVAQNSNGVPSGSAHVQGPALVRRLDPSGGQAGAAIERLGLVEVLLGEHAQADAPAHRRLGGALQHQAVVAGFLQPAQIEPIRRAIAHHQADQLAVEREARVEIADRENHDGSRG